MMDGALRTMEVRGVQYRVYEAGTGTPLLMLHGFTGSHQVFQPVVAALGKKFRCVIPDLLGHGQTDAPLAPSRYTMAETLADLACLLDELEISRAHVFGYSMGGASPSPSPSRIHIASIDLLSKARLPDCLRRKSGERGALPTKRSQPSWSARGL
ncbi:hypothetical protein GCM10025859_06990 [Alicyclobacillus fastidiosus]|nr:hypothetical protein GCM10025859_06990 [Alicyclobacillus fastidiosus]